MPPSYPPCVTPFSELKKTTIDSLLGEINHRGTYLLVRSLTPQNRATAVTAIVEDEKGDVHTVRLCYQPDDGEPLIREDTVMIIKEPFLAMAIDGSLVLHLTTTDGGGGQPAEGAGGGAAARGGGCGGRRGDCLRAGRDGAGRGGRRGRAGEDLHPAGGGGAAVGAV